MAAKASFDCLIEIGHSRLKVASYENGEISTVIAMPLAEFGDWLETTFESQAQPERAWLCAVPEDEMIQPVLTALSNTYIEARRVNNDALELPVALAYPGLGVDRWLALQPLWKRLQSAFVLVDCGTATTIDFVDETGIHQGGWILPGREASRHGLIAYAPGLKRSVNQVDTEPFGQAAADTSEAIERGLILQQAGAIRLALASLQQSSDQAIRLVLTGGDADCIGPAVQAALNEQNTSTPLISTLESRLQPVLILPDLVLEGLAMVAEQLR